MVAEERVIWKFTVSMWAKIISAAQIIYNAFSLIGSIYGLISLSSLTLYLGYIVLHAFGLMCGVLLLMGIRRQKQTFLMGWIGAAGAMIMVYIVGALVSAKLMAIIAAVISVPLHVFGIFMVYQYKQEIKSKSAGGGLATVT